MKFLTLARLKRTDVRVAQDLYESEMKTVRKPGKRHAIHETVRPSIVSNHCMLPERGCSIDRQLTAPKQNLPYALATAKFGGEYIGSADVIL